MDQEVALSVRGDARRTVAPDYATLQGQLTAFAPTKAEALAVVRAAQDGTTTALARLDGVALTVDSSHAPLTWSLGSVTTHDERDFDGTTGSSGRTGRVFAHGELFVTVRDLSRLSEVSDALNRITAFDLGGVRWHVEADNPAWRAVRADAIDAAVAKGHDYAAALGGSLRRIEHVADAGLLGGDDAHVGFDPEPGVAMAFGGSPGLPTLDPVPQQVRAVVEARLIADVPPLAAG